MAKPDNKKPEKGKPAAKKPANATPDDILPLKKLRPLLNLVKRDGKPLSIALAISAARDGVILLTKKPKKPKKLRSMLNDEADDVGLKLKDTSLRCGRVTLDGDETLLITLNKDAGSELEMAIRARVKHAGIKTVIFSTDMSIDDEKDEEEDDDDDDDDEIEEDEVSTAAAPDGESSGAQVEQPVPPSADILEQLRKRLGALIPQVATAPADQKAALTGLAQAAGAAVKEGSLDAVAKVDAFEEAILRASKAKTVADTAAVSGESPYAKPRLIWIATRKKMEDEIEKLRAQIVAAYQDDGIASDLEKRYADRVEPLLANLDASLADTLADAAKATDPAARATLVSEAKAIIARYQKVVSSEPIIADLDDNPFVPLAIQKTLSTTLTALAATVR